MRTDWPVPARRPRSQARRALRWRFSLAIAAAVSPQGCVSPDCKEALCFEDRDGDGWGDPSASVGYCGHLPRGCVLEGGDCDDHDANLNPGIPGACPGATDTATGTGR